MCHYCGCREIPLIKEFIAEHESVTDLAGNAVRALEHGEVGRARELIGRMAQELGAHWKGEENGLFAVMCEDDEYGAYIDALVREHQELAELLATADLDDAGDRARILQAVDELRHHIAKEEDGLFPASLTALTGPQWNRAMAAWSEAHPGAAPLGAPDLAPR